MREYILYAILIFMPLGFLMAYFLHREGLSRRQIACFTIAAMASVILFPICAARAGTTVTGVIFVFILALLSWQIVSASGRGMVTKDGPDMAQAVPELINEPLQDVISEPIKVTSSPVMSETDVLTEMAAAATEPQETIETPTIQIEAQDQVEAETIHFICSEPAGDEGQQNLPLQPGTSGIAQMNQTQADIEYSNEEHEPESYIIEPLPIIEEVTVEEVLSSDVIAMADSKCDQNEETNDPAVVNIVDERDDRDITAAINSMLDAGFEHKMEGNALETVRCFEAALNLTNSLKLKYLLSQELVSQYEILGQYTNAINIIKNIISSSGVVPTAELNQAQQKLEYLQYMLEELERLGLGDVPVSEVPRLIKIKVGQITR